MKSRIWIVTLLVVIGLASSACVVSATQYSYEIQDGNDKTIAYSPVNTISFDHIETEQWYLNNDEDGYYWNQNELRYIVFNNNVTVRQVKSSDEKIVWADKSMAYRNVVELERSGGGNCTVNVKVSTGEWVLFNIRSCKTPLKIDSPWVLSGSFCEILNSSYEGYDADLNACVVEDPSVIKACLVEHDDGGSNIVVYAQKPGETRVTVTSASGEQQALTVIVKKKAFKAAVKITDIYTYKKKAVYINTAPQAIINLKIDGKKYRLKADYKGYIKKKFSKRIVGKRYIMKVKCQGYSKIFKGKLY